jgi:hypothetical protein
MKRSNIFTLIISLLFVFSLSGCNLPFSQHTAANAQAATQPPMLPVTGDETAAPKAIETPQGVPTETAAPILTPTVESLEGIPTIALEHGATPGDPVYFSFQVTTDCDTGKRTPSDATAINNSGCDYWSREWLERPAASAASAYIPALDILWAQAGNADPWIFLRIKVHDLTSMPAGYQAGFELDSDLDSRGEFLILAQQPVSTQWATDGVQVWEDKNGDVGGTKPFVYDQNNGDGYEDNIFDSGLGLDPDLAWARISPNESNTIEFAFKASMLPNPKVFGWWPWVSLSTLTPAQFEPLDRETDEDLWNVDNTCSWIFGVTPKAHQLANLCAVVEPTATPVPLATNPSGGACKPPANGCAVGFWSQSQCRCLLIFHPTIIIIHTLPPPFIP